MIEDSAQAHGATYRGRRTGGLGDAAGDFPITERYSGEILSLPMYAGLTEEDQDHVIWAIRNFDFGADSFESRPVTTRKYTPAGSALAATAAD